MQLRDILYNSRSSQLESNDCLVTTKACFGVSITGKRSVPQTDGNVRAKLQCLELYKYNVLLKGYEEIVIVLIMTARKRNSIARM